MAPQKIKSVLSGAAAGAANGFFGAGGGLVLVPLLTRWLHLDQRRALATSVSIILPFCAVSAVMYLLRADLSLLQALPYLAGGAAGGIIGGWLFRRVPAVFLQKALAILILYGGVRSLL